MAAAVKRKKGEEGGRMILNAQMDRMRPPCPPYLTGRGRPDTIFMNGNSRLTRRLGVGRSVMIQ